MSNSKLVHKLKVIRYEGFLYLTNHIITRIPSHLIRLFFYRVFLGAKIGSDSYIFMGAWFDTIGNFSIGNHSVINQKCRLDNRGGIIIGNNVSISAEVCILTADHDLQSPDFEGHTRPVIIEDNVFIGTRAMILPGVTISKGAAVGAGAVVTKDVPTFTIVSGVPAKPMGNRCTHLDYEISYQRLFS